MTDSIAVLTASRGHHDELLGQVDGIAVGTRPPFLHNVISMGDRDLTRGRLPLGSDRWRTEVRPVPTARTSLPLAAARNLAAKHAVEDGAEVLVFLDGDIIPGARTLERYADAVTADRAGTPLENVEGPVLLTGPVLQLPPLAEGAAGYPMGQLRSIAVPMPGTPGVPPGEVRLETRWELFSGVSFAMSAADFTASGGFHVGYTGHGLEDADLAETVRRAGGALAWVGGATAYLQPGREVTPEQEVRTAVHHAQLWHDRWGEHSTHPWLTRLVGEGRLRRTEDGSYHA